MTIAQTIRLPGNAVSRTSDFAYATLRDRVRGRRFIVGGDWNMSPELGVRGRSCEIDPHLASSLGLSDHAPLVLEFGRRDLARTA